MDVVNTLGRRKTAIARIYLKEGSGNIQINKRDYKEFFPTATLHYVVEQPLLLTETKGKYRSGRGIALSNLTCTDQN